MDALRTPDERFAGLPGHAFTPHYRVWQGLRVHHLDEGPADAPVTALCLHGNPAWGYLYRHMIPVFAQAGLRVVAPDLVGFGRSDKPVDEAWHGFDVHRQMLIDLVEELDLRNVMLVCQDWGGILGLTLPMAAPERWTRLLVMNTTLATGELSEGFRQWRSYANTQPDLAVGRLLRRGRPELSRGRGLRCAVPRRPLQGRLACVPEPGARRPAGPGCCARERGPQLLARALAGPELHGRRRTRPGAGPRGDGGTARRYPRLSTAAGAARGRALRAGVGRASGPRRSGALRPRLSLERPT
jgi:pimeloyl-ACP methyl ester carboxylesterase